MKKSFVLALVLAMLLLLCACSSGPKEEVTFQNDLEVKLHSIYISPVTDEDWTEPLNYAALSSGSSIHIAFEKFAGDSAYYDIGVVDENGMNYDAYDVVLSIGDTLALSGSLDAATLTVTAADGSQKTYDAFVYDPADFE